MDRNLCTGSAYVLAEHDDGRRGVFVDVGGDDLALLVGELVQLLFELLETRLVATLDQQRDGFVGAGRHDLLGERLNLVKDRLVASQQGHLGLERRVIGRKGRRAILDFFNDLGDLVGELIAVHGIETIVLLTTLVRVHRECRSGEAP